MSMDETTVTLHALRDRLAERGVKATGPHRGIPAPEWDYLSLPGGRHVHVQRDSNGYWQALVYKGETLTRMADVDAHRLARRPRVSLDCGHERHAGGASPPGG